MHLLYHILLLIICFDTFIHCRGGGGRGGGRGGGGGRARSGRIGGGAGGGYGILDDSDRDAIFIYVSVICIPSIICTVVCVIGCRESSLSKKNSIIAKKEAYDVNRFQSGIWSSRYFKYNRWYNGADILLSFDSQLMNIIGSGSDDVGVFTIDGIYSTETNQIDLTIIYQRSTDDLTENLGHQITIQVTWNTPNGQFEGKWFVQTNTQRDEGEYTLKFKGTPGYV